MKDIKSHRRKIHSIENSHACEVCGKGFRCIEAMKSHVSYSHGNKVPLLCEFCDRSFIMKHSVNYHIATKHFDIAKGLPTIQKVKCESCGFETRDPASLKQHKSTVHLKEKKYKCERCEKTIAYRLGLNNHIKVYHFSEVKEEKCDHCDYRTQTKEKLSRHITYYHKPKDHSKRDDCHICEMSYPIKLSLTMHIASVHDETRYNLLKLTKYFNVICTYDAILNTEAILLGHKRVVHAEGKILHECTMCEYKGKTSQYLKHHMKTHVKEKSFQCDKCPKAFNQNGHLQRHIARMHTKANKKLNCDSCEYKTTTNQMLKLHVDAVHLGLRPYKCDVCQKVFTQPTHLRTHKRTHDINRLNYSCEQCDKSFSSTQSFNRHKLSHLAPEGKPVLKCDKCGFETNHQDSLRVHVRHIHEEKSFACEECGKLFSTKHFLKHHVESAHMGLKKSNATFAQRPSNQEPACFIIKRKIIEQIPNQT